MQEDQKLERGMKTDDMTVSQKGRTKKLPDGMISGGNLHA